MRKVAVLTTHRANNFGAVLQAFALVMAIRKLGAEGVILDWRCPHYEWLYHKAWRIYRNPLPAMQHLWHFLFTEKYARKLFSEFRGQIPMSGPIYRWKDLYKQEVFFNSFIVGSDQVWNPMNSAVIPQKFDRSYLLNFIQTGSKKNAYAASIGVDRIEPDGLVSEFVDAWRSFNIITMREYAGAKYVENMIKQPIQTVLDPVLLHERGFWKKIARQPSKVQKPYIFLYNVRRSSFLYDQAKQYAKEQTVELVDVLVPGLDYGASTNRKVTMGPTEFLSAIDGAEAIFTNSFHASAFSVLFGKTLYLHRRDVTGNPNTRIDTLVQNTEVTQKIHASEGDDQIFLYDCATTNHDKLQSVRAQSLALLEKMIS